MAEQAPGQVQKRRSASKDLRHFSGVTLMGNRQLSVNMHLAVDSIIALSVSEAVLSDPSHSDNHEVMRIAHAAGYNRLSQRLGRLEGPEQRDFAFRVADHMIDHEKAYKAEIQGAIKAAALPDVSL